MSTLQPTGPMFSDLGAIETLELTVQSFKPIEGGWQSIGRVLEPVLSASEEYEIEDREIFELWAGVSNLSIPDPDESDLVFTFGEPGRVPLAFAECKVGPPSGEIPSHYRNLYHDSEH